MAAMNHETLIFALDGWNPVLLSHFIISFAVGLVCLLAYSFLKPINRVYKAEDIGWMSKEDAKLSRRRKKIGNIPPVYPNGWFALAQSDKVKKKEVINVTALGESFAVFRTESGKVHILDAYCPHLGANMAAGGQVLGDCLECPFHEWRFSGDSGQCTYVPTQEKVPKSAKVKKWPSYECNGRIFVWYHAENVEPTWYPPHFSECTKYSCQHRAEYKFNVHVQDVFENSADFTHLDAIHKPSMLTGIDLRYFRRWTWLMSSHMEGVSWEPGTKGEEHTATMILRHYFTLLGRINLGYSNNYYPSQLIGPGMITNRVPVTNNDSMLVIVTVTPVEPLHQKVIMTVHAPAYLYPVVRFILANEFRVMMGRDLMVWQYKKFQEKPLLCKGDSNILRYRKWYSQFYSENSPTYQKAREHFDW